MFEFSASCETFKFKLGAAKIDEQSDFDSSGVQIINKLRLVLRKDGFDSLKFHEHIALHEKIGIKITDTFSSEQDTDGMLCNRQQTFLLQGQQKRLFIDRFKKT